MSVRAAFVLGVLLLLAALLHGGIYTAGHDFVVNRFTGSYEFVPGDDYDDWGGDTGAARPLRRGACTLTSMDPAARVGALQRRR